MPRSEFARLLAAKLADQRLAGHDAMRQDTIGTSAFDPLGHAALPVGALPTGVQAYVGSSATQPPRPRLRPAPVQLNGAQRDALTALRKLGAPLSENFDAYQLKAAFRTLAMDLHPDRHPTADAERREWLGLRFAVLCEAYHTLRTLDRR